jgi:hypothetical protein
MAHTDHDFMVIKTHFDIVHRMTFAQGLHTASLAYFDCRPFESGDKVFLQESHSYLLATGIYLRFCCGSIICKFV